MIKSIINCDIFTGETVLKNHAVVIENNTISQLIPQHQLPSTIDDRFDLNGGLLIPGFIDLQVNGGGGVLFNSAPTVEAISAIGAAHRRFGTIGFLPTLITDDFAVMREAIAAVKLAIAQGVPGVLGIHLEGPFLNAERKGAHDQNKFCLLDQEGFDIVTSLDAGKTLITIAPELSTSAMIKRICNKGVVVCAGHSAANYQQSFDALTAGLTGFTHLYNAMTAIQNREPGMVGAALENESSWFGIIADGYHVHPATFKAVVRAKQAGGAILVTDAMPTVGSSTKSFSLYGETIHAVNGRCQNAAGSLAGSDLDMISAVNNAAKFANIDWFEAVRMASTYPAQVLGLASRLGYIKPGYDASFIALDGQRSIFNTWINGDSMGAHQ